MVVLMVMSGKGGVGKSTVSVLLSLYLSQKGRKVSLLDLDICGPSISCFLGIKDPCITKDDNGLIKPYEYSQTLNCISMSFLLNRSDSAVIWRGPRKVAMIKEFCNNVAWGDYDILIIDTPPGIIDEHITLAEIFYGRDDVCALIVTSPHILSIDDVNRQITFCQRTGIKMLGIVENMSAIKCPNCQVFFCNDRECTPIFKGGDVKSIADTLNIPYIASLNFIPSICTTLDQGIDLFGENKNEEIETFFKSIKDALNFG